MKIIKRYKFQLVLDTNNCYHVCKNIKMVEIYYGRNSSESWKK